MALGEYNGCFEAGGGGVQGMFWRVVAVKLCNMRSMGTPYEIPSRYIHVKTATGLLGRSTEGAPAELLPPSSPSS